MTRRAAMAPSLTALASALYAATPETDAALTLAERPERLHGVWSPLEQLLDRIEASGEIDCVQGRPVFKEHGCWYEISAAVSGIVEFHERAQVRHGIAADTLPLTKLAKKLDFGSPLFADDLIRARECIAQCKRQAARLTVAQAVDLVRTVQIGIEMRLRG